MKVWGAEGTDTPDTPPEAPKSCAVTEGCSLEAGHEGDCVLHEARYQAEEGGEWVYDALADACAYVYEGGTVEVLRDIDLEESNADTYTYGESDKVKAKGIIVTKSMTITSAGDTPYTVTYSPKGRTYDRYYMNDQCNDHLINATDAGELYLENLILDGGRAEGRSSTAELVRIERSRLTLGSGAILQNNDNTYTSGGLFVRDGSAVMLEGSVIRNCRGDDGGGARVSAAASQTAEVGEKSSLTLQGGVIENCEANLGAGVYLAAGGLFAGPQDSPDNVDVGDSSELRLSSGAICGNKAIKNPNGKEGYGGGVYINEKDFGSCHVYMDGGTIEENTAASIGGGIYINNGKVHLEGGTITKNHAELYGGGIFVNLEDECDVFLRGTPVVDGNTCKDSDPCFYNVYLEGAEDYDYKPTRPITVEAPLSDDSSIGVSRWLRPDDTHLYRVVAKPAEGYTITTDDLDKFYSDDPKYVTLLHNNLEDSNDPDNGTIVITHADVAFDNQGHGKRPPSQLIDADKLVTKPEDPAEPGYTFESWYTEPECKTEWEFAEDKVTTDEKPQVLYAKWELNHYLIEYDLGEGGENDPANPDDYTVESENITLREPTRDGYQFMGWTLTELNEDLVASREPLSSTSRSRRSARSAAADEQQDGIPAGSIGYRKFTALWKKLPPYTVTYTDGVEDAEAFPDQVTGGLENEAATPAFEGTPARPGYTFTGWAPEVAETVTDDAVYVAQWKKNPPPPPSDDDDDDPPPKPPVTPPALESEEHFAYVVGYPDGTVRPEGNITRSEVVSIFFRLMTDEFREEHWAESNPFPDVDGEDWYHHAASTAVKAGLIRGLPDGTFGGERSITRAEFAAIAARFLSEETAPDSGFADLEGHWAKEEVDRAVDAGWIKGYPDGNFHPDEYITRAQVMTLVNRMLGRTPDTDGMREDMVRWPDCPQDAWYYADVQEATNSHAYEREAAGEPETWTALTENRDWTALER